ncbi:MAG TPA: ABC transporter permease subunit [Myxococcales bacterium]|nr:ABC transporter permease subunit [Myxococcales bacterium]
MTRLWLRGMVLVYAGALILLPLAAVFACGLGQGLPAFWEEVSRPRAAAAIRLTVGCSLLVAAVNAVMGTAAAWVLARHRIFGHRVLSSFVELPFALPTLLAGMMAVALFGPRSPLGAALERAGAPVAFAVPGIVLVLLFVTLPLQVRAVEPVALALDPAEEEAAMTLGASPAQSFFLVTLRALAPAIAYGALQSFGRALAEFGAVVVVSGNIPFRTLTAPVFVLGEVESGDTRAAAAVSCVLIFAAVALSLGTRAAKRRALGAPA